MVKQTTSHKPVKPLLASVLSVLSVLVMAGCGGKTQLTTSSGSPSPTPTPSSTGGLTATPASISFGSSTLNTKKSQAVKVTNAGNASVTVTQGSINGSEFSTGLTTPLTLSSGQSVNLTVVFSPTTAGTQSGNLTLSSSAATVLTIPMDGTGVAPLAHSVDISWAASTTAGLQGYNVYRGNVSGGPYSRISSALSPTTLLFTDSTVVSGLSYFYVVTAMNSSGVESVASNQVAVTIPTP